MKKETLIVAFFVWGLSLLLGISFAHAQGVPISFRPPMDLGGSPSSAGGSNYCLAIAGGGAASTGSDIPAPAVPDVSPTAVLVAADGNDYVIQGAYTAASPDCSSLPAGEQALCENLSSAFSRAVSAANLQSGFPQGTMKSSASGYGANNVSLQLASGVCGARDGSEVPLCESMVNIPNANGGSDVYAYIYFDLASLNNPTNSDEFPAAIFQSNAAFAGCSLAHELTHTFGLADIYNNGNYPGLMGYECANISHNSIPDQFPNYWSPNEAATVAWLNAGKAIVVNSDSCNYTCAAGQILKYQKNSTGSWTVSCVTPPGANQGNPDDISCNCHPMIGAPYCWDNTTQKFVNPPTQTFCAYQNISTCACANGQATCIDGNGAPAAVPEDFVCDAPTGATCECVYSGSVVVNVSCLDTNNNEISVPSDFTCAPPAANNGSSVSASGGYDCLADGTCVGDASGGQYPDLTSCQDSCVAN
jgi:hypothetical protein